MKGLLQSGTGADVLPLEGVHLYLYKANEAHRVTVANATTDSRGAFEMTPAVDSPPGIFYVSGDYDLRGMDLLAVLGAELPETIVVNELTTVAGVYSANQFLSDRELQGSTLGLKIAAAMSANLVDVTTGAASAVMTSPPNAGQTCGLRTLGSLANMFLSCLRGGDAGRGTLYSLGTPPGETPPRDSLAAIQNIARNPANEASAIYAQSQTMQTFQPVLDAAPLAWTLAVKVNDSGSDEQGKMFGGPGNLAFDEEGRAWILNNVVQGTPNATIWSIVLGYDGRPAVGADGALMSPFTGGGLLGPGFGIDIQRTTGNIWIGNFGWGDRYPEGSVSLFRSNGVPLSPPDGYPDALYRVQGTTVDDSGNVWMASYGNNSVVVYPGGNHLTPVVFRRQINFFPFGVAMAADGTAWVTNSSAAHSTLCRFRLAGDRLLLISETPAGREAKGVAVDRDGNVWVASGGDSHVYAFDPDGNRTGVFHGGGIDGPWGLVLDGEGHVWAGNFGPLLAKDESENTFTGRLTQLAGTGPDTAARGLQPGDPISPDQGYTLATAGDPVTLHNGVLLYGESSAPVYIPFMRTTGVNIDQGGNVWVCNNWKPNFQLDHEDNGNPGGDGMVIFIGMAKPPAVD
ncbi:MAG: hypothetical protein QOJ98_2658 [Acidobacteriota bacterium]|jgi:sugar lactone lactonase YvrE|nr:hypothetical protein [Acidobacteriota bacterium]